AGNGDNGGGILIVRLVELFVIILRLTKKKDNVPEVIKKRRTILRSPRLELLAHFANHVPVRSRLARVARTTRHIEHHPSRTDYRLSGGGRPHAPKRKVMGR